MVEKSLVMGFENELGKKVNVSIKDVIDEVTSDKANEIMDLIVSKKVFKTDGGFLVKKVSCEIVNKETTEISIG
ncbi:DUF2922 domain-containing protein [Clostridium thermobutyricum]|uniref:DUF2922 family protein n=1 Tax=Clostridium thermobutyricum DSM 4928 TaxID=1121339 RepID=A0A1V4SXA0_9CLOT|nr:DUF2922 domain-containing protein [Clostridium thermobutyricum]OPX49157.1 hypothetical protein CLTHE_09110 [Clostridium thermobutyricum DSM 4928]